MPNQNQITVYSTSNCPYCVAAKKLLSREGYAYSEIDVSTPELRTMLVKKSQGRKTVPQIFIGALHVGGFDDLQTLYKKGDLADIMNDEAAS